MINNPILKIKFLLERFLLKGANYQLLFIACLLGLISVVAGTALFYSNSETLKFGDAVWWAFLRLSDPGYLGDDHGVHRRTISTIVTILGYVLFMGSLVAIMSQWLNATMRKLESGFTPISLKGHFLILGWTSRTPTIIRQILLSEERVKRYLRLIKKSKLHIVILAEEVSSHLAYDLKESLGNLWDDRTIIFRSGNPLVIEHLKRVDFINAGAIIIPGENFPYYNPEKVDSHTLKIIMTFSNYYEIENVDALPDFVTEIYDPKKYNMLEAAYKGNISIISSNFFISRLIVQNVRHKSLSLIYAELLDNNGNEIYIMESGAFTEKKYIDIIPAFPNGILLGVLRKRDNHRTPILNPEPDFIIKDDDQFIVLAENYNKAYPDENNPVTAHKVEAREGLSPPSAVEDAQFFEQIHNSPVHYNDVYISKREVKKEKKTINFILILGWNNKVPVILNEFSLYNEKYTIDIFSQIPIPERNDFLKSNIITSKNLRINQYEGNYNDLNDFNRIKIEKYDNIIMLASDRFESTEESDARTIMGFMMLESIISQLPARKRPDILVEILDANNTILLQNKNCELIISPQIIGYLLSQIALRKSLNPIYDSLFKAGDADIFFRPADYFNMAGRELSFQEIENLVHIRYETTIGIQINSIKDFGEKPILNPAKNSLWRLSQDDNIIVLSS